MRSLNVPLTVTNVVAIAGGRAHGLAVIGDGSPRIFGDIAYRTKVSAGDLLPFFARAVGQAPLSYQWTSNGIPLVAPDAALPQIPAVPGNDDAAYQVTVTNTLGGATSTVARVAVRSINLWGRNTDGQCNIPDSVTNPMCIAAGGFHSLALDGTWDGRCLGEELGRPGERADGRDERCRHRRRRQPQLGAQGRRLRYWPGAATGMGKPMCPWRRPTRSPLRPAGLTVSP